MALTRRIDLFGASQYVQVQDGNCVANDRLRLDLIHQRLRESNILNYTHVEAIYIIPKLNLIQATLKNYLYLAETLICYLFAAIVLVLNRAQAQHGLIGQHDSSARPQVSIASK